MFSTKSFSKIQQLLIIYRQTNRLCFMYSSSSSSSSIQLGSTMKKLIDSKEYKKVLNLYDKHCEMCTDFAIDMTIKACIQLNDYERIKNIEKNLSTKSFNSSFIQTSLIQFHFQNGDIDKVLNISSRIANKSNYLYTIIFKGLNTHNRADIVLDLYDKMTINPDDHTIATIFSSCAQLANQRAMNIGRKLLDKISQNIQNKTSLLNSSIHMLMKFGDITKAEEFFQMIKKKNIITYGAMINGYNLNNQPLKSFNLFQQMKHENIKPNETIFILLIGTCSQTGLLSRCQYIVNQIPLHFYKNIQLNNSLIDMWGKAGSIKNAQQIFESINNPNIITYNAMINVFGLNRMGFEAIKLYKKISNNLHNERSHICVLNACSHSALHREAYSIFNQISNKTERIITTMIDCLSRLFLFDEAQKLINEYEKTNPPSLLMYMAILSGARNRRHSIISEKIYNKMKSLFPGEKDALISASILLANTYTSLGDSQRAEDIRLDRIKEFGKEVRVGLSWTEVNGTIVQFKAHDQSHPQSKEIYTELKQISAELIEYGHKYDSTWITRPLQKNETVESVLCGHSERLAIAFNFVARSNPSMIQITKNLRVCGDCHEATKLIAKIRKCEIIVRDASCIHHFYTNGQCSCQDHF
ncbi:unnamed protein product [Adineta steineri]|uniref:DYW domain-containing protein n=2 Tax=Adineta steineri TaxID=433720 RepID=A0A815E615_9BILA|nr:unnamed protein product [Adineta steineri]CAF1312077.1 unnamed protein product [Adineta steineri]